MIVIHTDAISIIEKIKPNIYCKGPDYKNFDKDVTKKIKKEIKILKNLEVNSKLQTIKHLVLVK